MIILAVSVISACNGQGQLEHRTTETVQFQGSLAKIFDKKLDTARWQVYLDKESGFSFKYPDNFTFEKRDSKNHPPGYTLFSDDRMTCHPITLTKYQNTENISNVLELPKSVFPGYHAQYHYKNSQEITINNMPFIFSDRMPYVIAAAVIIDDWVVELFTTDQYGGAYIPEECEAIYQTTLSTFSR